MSERPKSKDHRLVEHVIFVRDYNQTYIATSKANNPRRVSASCTAGREQAAERLAEKLMGDQPYTLDRPFKSNDRFYQVLVPVEEGM